MLKLLSRFAKVKWIGKMIPIFVGIPVIIQNNKGQVLLGKRSNKITIYPNCWGLPGGMMDRGEIAEETAIREVKEELGIKIKIVKRSNIIHNNFATKESPLQTINILFYAKITKGIPKPKDETKEVKWFSPKEIKKLDLAYNHKTILKDEGII